MNIFFFKAVHHRPEMFRGQLDFGTLNMESEYSMLLTLKNENPVNVRTSIVLLSPFIKRYIRFVNTLNIVPTIHFGRHNGVIPSTDWCDYRLI